MTLTMFAKKYALSFPTALRTRLALSSFVSATVLSLLLSSSVLASSPQVEKDQAELYKKTLSAIKKGHKTNTNSGMAALSNYPLYPYLEKALIEKKLRSLPFGEVDAFLSQYQRTVVAKQLQRKWLKTLATKNQWDAYIRYYQQDLANSSLRCYYLEALYQEGYEEAAVAQTSKLWLSGKSLPDACDAVFKRWEVAGGKTDQLVWKRSLLALEANNTQLARYLSKHASASLKPYTRRLLSIHRRPQDLRDQQRFDKKSSVYNADIVAHGLNRLAKKDALLASQLWTNYQGLVPLSPTQNHQLRDAMARQIIASGSEQAIDWLISHDPNAEDAYLLEWRIRLALKGGQWQQADRWIHLLPEELQQQPRWRYWSARTQAQLGNEITSNRLLIQLANERNYYGFLAADSLNVDYDFNHDALNPNNLNTPLLSPLDTEPALKRAQAFYQMGYYTSARREWFAGLKQLDQQQLLAATQMAHQWGWHQQAIHTTIKAQHWDDLTVRFPLAFESDMKHFASSRAIRLEWLYAITRQESAFATDAFSSAGAKGLMQLRPSTAKQMAKKLGVTFKSNDLFQPEHNIAYGSNYLKHLLEEYQGNHILATAAYNAGPHRVNKWLKRQPRSLPYDIWIETLPFHETRNYVQNVLAFSVIYGHRLGLDTRLIGKQESIIGN